MKIESFSGKFLPMRPATRKILLSVIVTAFSLLMLFSSLKNLVFEKGLDRLASKFADIGYHFTWNDTRVMGFNRVSINDLQITSENDSSMIGVDSMAMKFGLFPALRGRISIEKLTCHNIKVLYTDHKSGHDTITSRGAPSIPIGSNYAGLANRIVRRLIMAIPRELYIDTVDLKLNMPENILVFAFHDTRISQGVLKSYLNTGGKSEAATILLEGRISRKHLFIELMARNPYQKSCALLIPGKYPVLAGFDTLHFTFSLPHYSAKMVTIKGASVSKGFTLKGERLSANTITINRLLSSFTMHIKPRSVELDSSSLLTVNNISFHPYALVRKNPQLAMDVKICPVIWDAGVFFRSLPGGMFSSLTGFNASGDLRFFADLSLDMRSVDSLYFTSKLQSGNFRILNFGIDDYRMMNAEFIHRFFDRGSLTAYFHVGPSNPDFSALTEISPWLKISVLTSEDGGFYNHNGFNQDAIRESLITNIKEGKFVRGGSTISMQLVKNVFLTRNKTIGRKLEELLIVWIIEKNRLVSKDRMLEVYLNVIEWGPGIYGINQASAYYFNKKPADLNLKEGIFLAGIVPFPKRFKSVFDTNGSPRAYFVNYMQRMKDLMVARNRILPEDTVGIDTRVFLAGPASRVFVIPDTLLTDTLQPGEMIIPH